MSRFNKLWAAVVAPAVAILAAALEFAGLALPWTQDQLIAVLMGLTPLFVYLAPKNAGEGDA
jgi:predicted ATPase